MLVSKEIAGGAGPAVPQEVPKGKLKRSINPARKGVV